MANRRGVGMVDVILTIFLFGMAAVVFTATFPSGIAISRQCGEQKVALAIAQKKMEQAQDLGYESLTYSNLRADNAIDATPTSSVYSFASVDSLANYLPGATVGSPITLKGELQIDDDATNRIKYVKVTVSWLSPITKEDGTPFLRSVSLETLVADKRPTGG